jgi:hypothetical protein
MPMTTDITESVANGLGNEKETLYLMGGVAMIVFGTGLILSNPLIRRYMANLGVGNFAQAVMPDVERYFKLRAM